MQTSPTARRLVAAGVTGLTVIVGVAAATGSPAAAHSTGIHDNCTNLNAKWPHGVGLRNAVDRTSGAPVTAFRRSSEAYRAADRHNGTLDRDGDGIACEKR